MWDEERGQKGREARSERRAEERGWRLDEQTVNKRTRRKSGKSESNRTENKKEKDMT